MKRASHIFGIAALLVLSVCLVSSTVNAQNDGEDVLLTSPSALWLGDEGEIDLRLVVDEWLAVIQPPGEGQPNVIDLYNEYQVVVETQLQMVGMAYSPTGVSLEPISPGKQVRFSWRVSAVRPGDASGTVWVHLRLIPKAGGEELRLPLYAFPVHVVVRDVWGIETRYVRWVLLGVALPALAILGVEIKRRMDAVGQVD